MEKGFTLVIPLYNKRDAIRQTLDSVLNNHGSYPFRCIVVDDDSTDGSSEIAEEYDMNYPDVFQYIKKKHHGNKTPAYARNLGIKLAETEYIGFLDADDELCAGFIDRGCNFLDEHPEYTMYSNGYIIHYRNENGDDVYEDKYVVTHMNAIDNFQDILSVNFNVVSFCAGVYKTELAKDTLFGNVYVEDVVFKLEYSYRHLPIYVDSSTSKSIIYHTMYGNSQEWNLQKTNNNSIFETLLTFKDKAKCNDFDFFVDENDRVFYEYYGDVR